MRYEYMLFDLDGTLSDPGIGITSAVMHALEKYGIYESDRTKLYPFIGPPLLDSFQDFYGFSEEQAKEAIAFYREYYNTQGKFENKVYEGIPQMLKRLQDSGRKLFVATSKVESIAKEVLEHFQLTSYFIDIAGPDMKQHRTQKAEIIERLFKDQGITKRDRVVMVGDRKHDVIAAKANGIHSIGVLYGYGSREELTAAGAEELAVSVQELEGLLTIE